jgi:hypothetical protein
MKLSCRRPNLQVSLKLVKLKVGNGRRRKEKTVKKKRMKDNAVLCSSLASPHLISGEKSADSQHEAVGCGV